MEIERLTAFAPLAGLPQPELEALAAAFQEIDIAAGRQVVGHGDFGQALYAVEEGEAEVILEGREERGSVGPGDTFGEIGLLMAGRRTATVVALTDMHLLLLFQRDFLRIRDSVPEFEVELRRIGAERLAQ